MVISTAPVRRAAVSLLGSLLLAGCQTSTPAGPAPKPAASPSSQPASIRPAATDPGLTSSQRLTALADAVTAAPGDGDTGLPYTYLHTQSWSRATNVITRTDLRQWRRQTDGSGRESTRRLPDLPGVDHQPQRQEQSQLAHASETTTTYPPGTLRPYLPEPLPTTARSLADALAPRQLAAESAYPRILVGGIVTLVSSQYLSRQQRATTLRVLASVPGITYRGLTRGLLGRTGLTFAVAAGGSTIELLVDPRTGEVLAAQEHLTERLRGLFSYVLILERGHATSPTAAE
ncbi:hypothetical protein [Micromonospora sp. DT227]|uniref:hypothetical protein n=1 Tax=Micromonospora sp. DT227 TaxID=3393433 RepID=UPI003CF88698